MASYSNLLFQDLLKESTLKNEKTGRMNNLEEVIDVHLQDVRKKCYQNGGNGTLIIKLKFKKGKERENLSMSARVSTILPEAQNCLELFQNEKAEIFLDQPNQQVLAGVLNCGTSENKEKA